MRGGGAKECCRHVTPWYWVRRQIAGPVTVAFGKPVLSLPANFAEECSEDDFFAALAHECVHMRRNDFWKNLFYEMASLPVAFHPVTWMVKSRIAQTREMICDATATEKLIDSHTYAQSLLRLATMVSLGSRVAPSHAIGIFDADILEERVMRMNGKKRHHSAFVRYGLMIPAAVLLLSVAAGAGAMTVAVGPQESSQSSGEAQKIDKDVVPPKMISSPVPVYPEAEKKMKGKVRRQLRCRDDCGQGWRSLRTSMSFGRWRRTSMQAQSRRSSNIALLLRREPEK